VSEVAQHRAASSDDLAAQDAIEFDELWRPSDTGAARRGPEQDLLQRGVVTQKQIDDARARQRDDPRLSVLDALTEIGAIDEATALRALGEYFGLPFVHVTPAEIDEDVLGMLPMEYVRAKLVLPVTRGEDNVVVVGICDPADMFLIEDVKRRLGRQVRLVLILPHDVHQVLETFSATPNHQVEDIIKDIAEDAVEVVDSKTEEVADLENLAGESPVIRYVNFLISSAVKEAASDIHIEPTENRLRVRLRIDGVLFEQGQCPPIQMHAAIISRLKIMANLDIAERRLPQDGRIRATVHGRTIDLRVSTLPVTSGEKCVIRILDNRSIMVGLEQLGMQEDTFAGFRHQVLQPHGIVLVTGPTGSGKSTTLYSALQVMDASKLNISTVEDPVEYELQTINQVNVHDSIGMSFSAALRSLLRQDPDVIMLGEIRDEETAHIAVQASLTGHLVLSTLHTNDAPASITRLVNIGVESYLISAAVNAVLAQRLVRRICTNCKAEQTDVPEHVSAFLRKFDANPDKLYHGVGCEKCRHTGYKGRVGLYELLVLDDEMRDLITSSPVLNVLREAARGSGMRTLRGDGLIKVGQGLTTVDELMRMTES